MKTGEAWICVRYGKEFKDTNSRILDMAHGNRVVDFLLVLIEIFRQLSRLRRYDWIFVKIVLFERGWVTLSANFRGKEVVHQRL